MFGKNSGRLLRAVVKLQKLRQEYKLAIFDNYLAEARDLYPQIIKAREMVQYHKDLCDVEHKGEEPLDSKQSIRENGMVTMNLMPANFTIYTTINEKSSEMNDWIKRIRQGV